MGHQFMYTHIQLHDDGRHNLLTACYILRRQQGNVFKILHYRKTRKKFLFAISRGLSESRLTFYADLALFDQMTTLWKHDEKSHIYKLNDILWGHTMVAEEKWFFVNAMEITFILKLYLIYLFNENIIYSYFIIRTTLEFFMGT